MGWRPRLEGSRAHRFQVKRGLGRSTESKCWASQRIAAELWRIHDFVIVLAGGGSLGSSLRQRFAARNMSPAHGCSRWMDGGSTVEPPFATSRCATTPHPAGGATSRWLARRPHMRRTVPSRLCKDVHYVVVDTVASYGRYWTRTGLYKTGGCAVRRVGSILIASGGC